MLLVRCAVALLQAQEAIVFFTLAANDPSRLGTGTRLREAREKKDEKQAPPS